MVLCPFWSNFKDEGVAKTTPYTHTPRPEIKQYMNKYQWDENILQETQENILSTTTSQTPVPQEKHDKVPREEESYLVTEIESKHFLIYTKSLPKKNPPPVFMQDEEGNITIVMIGKHVSTTSKDIYLGTSKYDIFTRSPSSSTFMDPPETPQTIDLA